MLQKRYFFSFLLTTALIVVFVVACSSSNDEPTPPTAFDRKAMLQNYADNLIRPGFRDLQTNVNALSTLSLIHI